MQPAYIDLAMITAPDGIAELVDIVLCRAVTKPYPPQRVTHILEELRIAHAVDVAHRRRR